MRSPCTATKSSLYSLQLEKARVQQRRPNAAKKKKNICQVAINSEYQYIPGGYHP